jgi:metal-sulfur cluster biosynthetic enzyme
MQDERASGARPTREAVLGALEECYDPCCRERGISVVDMGLVERVAIEGQSVGIDLVLTTGWCPFVARLFDMVEERVGALPGVQEVRVAAVWDTPWTPERMSEGAREKLRLPLEQLRPLREARLRLTTSTTTNTDDS